MRRAAGLILSLVVMLPAGVAPAAKYAALVGGSSDNRDERPGFRKNFDTLNRGLIARGWETQVLFSDGDTKMPAREAANTLIQAAVDEIAEKAKAGDQVLYFFCGHGTQRQDRRGRGRAGEISHSLQTQNGQFFSLDSLRDDLKTLREKKVRVAVVDLSCFSGATQSSDFTSRASVITLAATRYVSQCGTYDRSGIFTQKFVKLPDVAKQADVSLLDQFLAARVADPESANFAQVSCIAAPAGAAWQTLWHDTDPANERRADSFDGRPVNPLRFNRIAAAIKENRAKIAADYAKIIADEASPDRKEQLQKLTDELEKKLDAYIADYTDLEKACGDIRTTLSQHMNWAFTGPAARFNRQSLGDLKEMIREARSGVPAGQYTGPGSRNRDLYAQVVKDSTRLGKVLDELMKQLGDAWPRYEKLTAALNQHGEEVMKVERKLYDLYARSLKLDDVDDGCDAFKF